MPGNGDHDSSSFSESIPLGSLPSCRSEHLTISILQPLDRKNSKLEEEHGDDRLTNKDATSLPLGVKLTVYRLVLMTTVLSFGAAKSILTYKGQSIAPTTLDWVSGAFLIVVRCWFGLYGTSIKWKWFFQDDLAPAIGYCAKRAVAEFIWLLFHLDGWPIFSSLGLSLCWLFAHVHACYFPHVSIPSCAWFAIGLGICLFVLLLWLIVQRVARRVLDRGRECAMGFVDIYAPGVPRAERYGWSGAVGTIVRFFCGTALFLLPYVVFFMTTLDQC